MVEDALAAKLLGDGEIDARTKAALVNLRRTGDARAPMLRDGVFNGPPVFKVGPGLNLIGPPYDFGLNVALGSNKPAIINDVSTGRFAVVATARFEHNTFGSAGVALFIVPSNPKRTLSIRPYFEWRYVFSCESHGPPTAHSSGVIKTEASGHRGSVTSGFPGKSLELWRGSSDAWDDDQGNDSGVFVGLDSELVVSGSDFYTASFVCQASADSGDGSFGWFSEAFVQLHCRVPFIVVEEH